jgi:hypothetical protein
VCDEPGGNRLSLVEVDGCSACGLVPPGFPVGDLLVGETQRNGQRLNERLCLQATALLTPKVVRQLSSVDALLGGDHGDVGQ